MTEEEAKVKWCPFARCEGGYVGGQPTHNRRMGYLPSAADDDGDPTVDGARILVLPQASFCIAASCMAWRKIAGSTGPQIAVGRDGTRLPMPSPEAAAAHAASGWTIEGGPPDGFCGLAGRPE